MRGNCGGMALTVHEMLLRCGEHLPSASQPSIPSSHCSAHVPAPALPIAFDAALDLLVDAPVEQKKLREELADQFERARAASTRTDHEQRALASLYVHITNLSNSTEGSRVAVGDINIGLRSQFGNESDVTPGSWGIDGRRFADDATAYQQLEALVARCVGPAATHERAYSEAATMMMRMTLR